MIHDTYEQYLNSYGTDRMKIGYDGWQGYRFLLVRGADGYWHYADWMIQIDEKRYAVAAIDDGTVRSILFNNPVQEVTIMSHTQEVTIPAVRVR